MILNARTVGMGGRSRMRKFGMLFSITLICLSVFIMAQPTQSAPEHERTTQQSSVRGFVLGQIIDPNTCSITYDINRVNQALNEIQPNWVRVNLIGASPNYGCPDADAEYTKVINAIKNANSNIIGLLSQDFMKDLPYTNYTSGNWSIYTQTFAAEAQSIAEQSPYNMIDVWEIWNEPDFLAPLNETQFAELLVEAEQKIAPVISGGVTPGNPIPYLQNVSSVLQTNHGISLTQLVDGIGIHPYTIVGYDSNGSNGLDDFLYAFNQAFPGEPLYITEFGWAVPPESQVMQCQYLIDSYNLAIPNQNVQAATWFQLEYYNEGAKEWGLYDINNQKRLAYYGLKDLTCPNTLPTPTPNPCSSSNANNISLSEGVDNICPTATLQYVSRGSYGVGTNCANPTASPSSNNWRFRADGIPAGFEPVLLTDGDSAIWRKAPPCDSVSRWPLVATRDVAPGVGNTYGWTIDVVGWPGTLPTQGRIYSLTLRNGGNDFTISTIARP